jgi:phospholipid-binding lipoprotein MlaA
MPTSRCRGTILLALALTWLTGASRADEPEPGVLPEGEVAVPADAEESDQLLDAEEAEEEEGDFEPAEPIGDPLEPANRAIFGFNRQLDRWFWTPITDAYQFVTPEPVRRGVRRVFRNLNTPIFFVNNVLQLRFRDAGETLGSFALNSTLGVLGFFEPSREAGWEPHPADFGQTLHLVGVGSGPYVVVPILGPTTVRDGFGSAVDRFFQPLSYMLGIPTQLLWGGGAGLSLRDESAEALEALEESSVDYYAAMRSAYVQSREKQAADARGRRDADLALIVPDSWRCGESGKPPAQD